MLETAVVLAAWLVSLVAGLLLVFAIVVMPGIATLDDLAFLRAFKVMDRVIQDNQPIFMIVWGGSILASLAAVGLSVSGAEGSARALVVFGGVGYLLGVQVTTFRVNIPLNNAVQAADLLAMDDRALEQARAAFEPRWVRANRFRTTVAALAALCLISSALII